MRASLRTNEALAVTDEVLVECQEVLRWCQTRPPLVQSEASVALLAGTEWPSASSLLCLHTSMPAPELLVARPLFFMNFQDRSLCRVANAQH